MVHGKREEKKKPSGLNAELLLNLATAIANLITAIINAMIAVLR